MGEKKIYDTLNGPVRQIWAEVLPAKYNDDTQLNFEMNRGENRKDYDFKLK